MRAFAADVVHERSVLLDGVRTLHGHKHAIAGMLKRQMEVRGEAVAGRHQLDDIRVQSMGSSELMRKSDRRSGRLSAGRAGAAATSDVGGVRSRPYDPRWTPVNAISL